MFIIVIDVFTKYVWVRPLKDIKGKTVLNSFIEIVSESNCKLNRVWVHQESFTINLCINGKAIMF